MSAASSPSRLILHCGVQKTASTSLHQFLQSNRGDLRRHMAVLTPIKGSATRSLGRAAAKFSIEPQAEPEFVAAIKTVRDQVLAEGIDCLISHENLVGAMIGRAGVTALYPHITQTIDLLDEHFSPFVPEYVFYTREMGAWKKSVYGQAVKSDQYAHSFSAFQKATRNCGSWNDFFARVRDHAGIDRAHMFALEEEKQPEFPGMQLLKHAGLSERQVLQLAPQSSKRNKSLNSGSLEFMRLVNSLRLAAEPRREIARLVTQNQSLFANT